MNMDETNGVDRDVIDRLQARYWNDTQDLFWWMWSELRSRCPDISCRTTKRYNAIYLSQYTSRLVAYLDFKCSGLRVGIRNSVFRNAKPDIITDEAFPDWNSKEEFRSFYLTRREPEIIDLLEQAYRGRDQGISAVNPLRTLEKRKALTDAKAREDAVRRHLAILKDEEAPLEGAERERYSVFAERNPKLRLAAIKHHGTDCMVCGFSFHRFYGEIGEYFIEVHHIHPLRSLKGPTKVNPTTDLVVVCSNCHRMIHHKKNKVLSIEEIKSHVQNKAENTQ